MSAEFEIELPLFVEAVFRKYHYDFRDYAAASLKRRLHTALSRFGCGSLSQLQHRMLHEPEYYRALRTQVLPLLRTYPSLKIWVAGCSTGEEVYSLAILLQEEGLLKRSLIYGTDINAHALRKAEAGVYDIDRIALFSQNYQRTGAHNSLSAYYTAAYGSAVFDAALKKHIVFSDHSLATDSVFAEMQFVSCRNVLIYFNRALQDRAVGLFRDALCLRGFLGIGSKESLRFSSYADAFDSIDRENRVYRKVSVS
jgi:chemotaxis protein methyltransferase CheR